MDLQTAKGVKDVPPEEKSVKNKVVNTLIEVFEVYGFAPLETPLLERYETLAAKFTAGEESDALKETFSLLDQGQRKLGLRFDLTVPLGRFMAMNPNLKMPFKRYEIGPVFRDGPIKLGRYREFWQCDIDVIGSNSMLAEAEILAVVQSVFEKLKVDVIIKVNNRKLLNGILEQNGINEKEQAIISIDKLDKIGEKGVIDELQQKGCKEKQVKDVLNLIKENKVSELKKKVTNPEGLQGIQELEELFGYLKTMGVQKVQFSASLARGLAYYTGTVYEAFEKKGTISSSLAGGGRWDNMIGKFLEKNEIVPAVGVAFGLEPIMDLLKLQNKIEMKRTPAQVYVLPINTIKESLEVVQELRAAGIKSDFCLGKKGVSKNLEYASALGIPYVIIIGEDELKKNKVLLRDMISGTEQLLAVKDVVKKIRG